MCSFSVQISVRTGALLGEGRPKVAKTLSMAAIALGVMCSGTAALIVLLARNIIGPIFTKDPRVIKSVSALAPLVSVFISCDGVQGVAQGITRGTAMQNWGATFVIVANYFIALPLGFFLAFVPHAKLGLFGLWSGTSSMSMVDTYFFNLILRMTEYFTNLM